MAVARRVAYGLPCAFLFPACGGSSFSSDATGGLDGGGGASVADASVADVVDSGSAEATPEDLFDSGGRDGSMDPGGGGASDSGTIDSGGGDASGSGPIDSGQGDASDSGAGDARPGGAADSGAGDAGAGGPPDSGLRCAASCTATCMSCALPGLLGTCASLPQGVDDSVNHCEDNAVCDGNGACEGSSGKGHFGDACVQDSDCFNGTCAASVCKLPNGDACAEDAACGSGRCVASVCAACGGDADCASGQCNADTCLLLGGFLCAADTDCASSSCTFNQKTCVQAGGEACTTAGCLTHFCSGGLCQTCSRSSDCPLGTPCTGGECLAPPGAYCRVNTDCASGMCGPAALLGMAKCQ